MWSAWVLSASPSPTACLLAHPPLSSRGPLAGLGLVGSPEVEGARVRGGHQHRRPLLRSCGGAVAAM
eukprot:4573376-Pyramimonas_sp.AAC.1